MTNLPRSHWRRHLIFYKWPVRNFECLDKLYENIVKSKVLDGLHENVCDATVKLLIEFIWVQQKMSYRDKNEVKMKWLKRFADELHTQLNSICTDAMEMNSASKTVAKFFEKFNLLWN